MVQFYALLGFFQNPRIWRDLKKKGGIIKGNKDIRENFYNCMSRNLWDKLVRREVYIKSVNFMKDELFLIMTIRLFLDYYMSLKLMDSWKI